MNYYVDYDPLRGEIIDYYITNPSLATDFQRFYVHFDLDKVYHTNATFSVVRPDDTGKEFWYKIPVERVQNKLRELIREKKLNDLLCKL